MTTKQIITQLQYALDDLENKEPYVVRAATRIAQLMATLAAEEDQDKPAPADVVSG